MRPTVLLASVLFFAATVIAGDPVPEKHHGPNRVYDKDAGFSLVTPNGWTPVKNSDAAFITLKQAQADGIANINVRWVKYDGTPLAKIADALKAGMPKKFKDWKCVGEGTPTIDGKTCYSIGSRYTSQLEGKSIELQSLQFLIPTDKGKAYIVTCTARASQFDQLKATFDATAATCRTE